MQQVLNIGPDEISRVNKVCKYAMTHRISRETLQLMIDGTVMPPGDNPRHVCLIPEGFRCVFTVDALRAGVGHARHLSVSMTNSDKYASPQSVATLMVLFGFEKFMDSDEVTVTPEHRMYGVMAVNIYERFIEM